MRDDVVEGTAVRGTAARALGAVLALWLGATAAAPAAAAPREELEQLRRQLEAALQQGEGLPPLLGESRTYYVRGEGALVALAPRALPSRPRGVFLPDGAARPGSPDPGEPDREQDPVLQEIAAQMAAMEREAERARREAQRAFEQVARRIRLRVGDGPVPVPRVDDPDAPPPWHFWFEVSETRAAPEPADLERSVSRAREALAGSLAAHPPALEALEPSEFLAVAVDFVGGGLLVPAPPPERTLMVRVRKRDLEALRSGRIDAAEFRSRLRYDEY